MLKCGCSKWGQFARLLSVGHCFLSGGPVRVEGARDHVSDSLNQPNEMSTINVPSTAVFFLSSAACTNPGVMSAAISRSENGHGWLNVGKVCYFMFT